MRWVGGLKWPAACSFLAILLAAGAAPAAEGTDAPGSDESAAEVRVGRNGFVLRTADRAFYLRIGGYIQADARVFAGENEPSLPDTFLIRRGRPIVEGTVYRSFNYRLMPDFGGGVVVLDDAWVEYRMLEALQLRVGKYKVPFGLERLMTATDLFFVERALPTLLVPNRDVGAELHGELLDGAIAWFAGLFNGVPDDGNLDQDADHGKDVAARIFVHPARPFGVDALRELGIGFAASYGKANGSLARPELASPASSGKRTFFRFRTGETLEDTTIADGKRYRFSPQLYWFWGPFGLLSEFVTSTSDVRRGETERRLTNHAWQVAGTFVFGGDRRFTGVTPHRSVGEGGVGAFDVSARYDELRVDPRAFPTFADPATAERVARNWAVNLGWWPSPLSRFMVTFDRTTFEAADEAKGAVSAENLFALRSQVAW